MSFDFLEPERTMQDYLSSEENLKAVVSMDTRCKNYLDLREKYALSFDELLKTAERRVLRKEYAKGGETVHRGFYFPGYATLFVGGMNRGRLLKRAPKDNRYNYEYWFDAEGKMICAFKYAKNLNFRLVEVEFLIYQNDEVMSVIFEKVQNNTYWLHGISNCYFSDNRLSRYELVWFCVTETESAHTEMIETESWETLIKSHCLQVKCSHVRVEECVRENGLMKDLHWFCYYPDFKSLNHQLIQFNRSQEGFLTSYTIKQISGFNRFPFSENESQVYEVLEKRKDD